MNIAKYISELLFDYECVVLPGLGGFIINRKPATVNKITNQFTPPYSQVFFNVHLASNDGLLVNYIAGREALNYADVKSQVDDFVRQTEERLLLGEKILLEKIGVLEHDENNNIRFEQSRSVNYNADSFGLSNFTSPAIIRETDEERLRALILPGSKPKRTPHDRKAEKKTTVKRKGFVRSGLSIALLAVLIGSLSWGLIQKEQVAEYWYEQASLLPFVNAEQNYQPRADMSVYNKDTDLSAVIEVEKSPVIETPAEKIDAPADTETKLDQPVVKKEMTVEKSSLPEPKAEPAIIPAAKKDNKTTPKISPSGKLYYVIAGSFSSEANAEKLVESLKEKGYRAMIADTNKYGMYRVAYVGIEDYSTAKERLYAIRQEDNSEAWILKK